MPATGTLTMPADVKERPILFSAPMVRAILAGTKTQTRRVVKTPKGIVSLYRPFPNDPQNVQGIDADGIIGWYAIPSVCPYGQPGDRLWVRETFAKRLDCQDGSDKAKHYVMYRADCAGESGPTDPMNWHDYGDGWTPSIFMPRWASRITLELTAVRVERLQEIGEKDARAEGINDPLCVEVSTLATGCATYSYAAAYRMLWDKINGKRAPWDSNPWVWAITFTRVENV